MKFFYLLLMVCSFQSYLFAQQNKKDDSVHAKVLDSVLVSAYLKYGNAGHLADVQNVYIYAGKKTNTVQMNSINVNVAQNVARMAFAQIPGLNIWEMDGAGTQVNIGSRGTDTHRSIEMNMRQNGYVTNSDIFGYPEDHYTPPMQGIQQVQLVRGSAALQFGSQFGGMMNYVMKEGDSTKTVAVESEQTKGSNNFFNSYNAVGGTVGKVNYYAYYDNRSGDGWRPNARFNYHAYYANIKYNFSNKGNISFQFSRMDYVQQIAGGLTDSQFNKNSRQSFRARNFFNPEINIPAIIFNYHFSNNTFLSVTSHGLIGQRNSVQFINTPNIMDTINKVLGTYNPRQIDRDYYTAFTTEARLLHKYKIGNIQSTFAGGVRYSTELTRRRQKGIGTIGSDFDLEITKRQRPDSAEYAIDLHLTTNNYAFFAENIFQLTKKLSVTPGVRYEIIDSKLTGIIPNTSTALAFPVSYKGNRNFPLFGTGLQYQVNHSSQLYGNISQAYRPYLYASITPADQIGIIDPNLKDSKGYDVDLGYRGHYKDLIRFDVNAFAMYYGNRVGQLTLTNPDSTTYLYTTNIGNSLDKGIEAYVELSIWKLLINTNSDFNISVFNSLSYNHARYVSGEINNNGKNVSLKGNYVEGVPDWINRAGLKFEFKNVTTNFQYSYVNKGYSDANNTIFNVIGATGVVPAYHVWDWAFNYNFLEHYHISAGINNLANASYFTRRINMYPGPGILPADGRTYYISFGIKL
jgi:Fe(3+) dicitrate transport protein